MNMDERLEKAFQTANYMVTLSNQRRLALEELKQQSIYYTEGAAFTVNRELISFISALINMNYKSTVILDDNSIPVEIKNCEKFLQAIMEIYNESMNSYLKKFAEIKSKRKINDLISL